MVETLLVAAPERRSPVVELVDFVFVYASEEPYPAPWSVSRLVVLSAAGILAAVGKLL